MHLIARHFNAGSEYVPGNAPLDNSGPALLYSRCQNFIVSLPSVRRGQRALKWGSPVHPAFIGKISPALSRNCEEDFSSEPDYQPRVPSGICRLTFHACARQAEGCRILSRPVSGAAPPCRAFTLIELLVVVAILAILTAILFLFSKKCVKMRGEHPALPTSNN